MFITNKDLSVNDLRSGIAYFLLHYSLIDIRYSVLFPSLNFEHRTPINDLRFGNASFLLHYSLIDIRYLILYTSNEFRTQTPNLLESQLII